MFNSLVNSLQVLWSEHYTTAPAWISNLCIRLIRGTSTHQHYIHDKLHNMYVVSRKKSHRYTMLFFSKICYNPDLCITD
jgi:hypothetical protein